jgi:tetratricopeptide (TPR) repeat protein
VKAGNPLPIWGLAAILLGCAITFYFLAPDQRKLLGRLVQDGKAKRALKVLESVSEAQKAKDPEFYEVMRLRLSRQVLKPTDKPGITAQLEQALHALDRFSSRQDFVAEVVQSLALLNDPARALQLVSPHFSRISIPARQTLVAAMVGDALASNSPEVAAETFENCLRPFPPAETNLVEAVRLWRGAAKADRALAVLEAFEKQSSADSFALNPILMELKFNLLRELDRVGEAFEIAATQTRQSGDNMDGQRWLRRMRETAGTAPQYRKLLQEYRERVQANPGDGEAWRFIAETAIGAGDLVLATEAFQQLIRVGPADMAAHKQLAQLYEWSGEPGRAFDLYVKLADQKDAGALERLIALNPGLYRDMDVLRLLGGIDGEGTQDKHLLILARLLIKHGKYPEANRVYQKHLQHEPRDTTVMEEYAQALKRQHAYERALGIWEGLQELKPEDEAVRAQIAEICYLLGDFESSLHAYQRLARRSTDLPTIINYATLAESLGDFQSLSEALHREMELKPQVTPGDFTKLAYVFRLLGADLKRQEALERGLIQFPESDALRIQLCILLLEQKEPRQALSVLARNLNLKTDLAALELYLGLLIRHREWATADKFLQSGVDEKILAAPSISVLRALIYEGNGNDVAAEKIHQKLCNDFPEESAYALNYVNVLTKVGKTRKAQSILEPLLKDPTPAILKKAVGFHVEFGNYKEAERLQGQLLEISGKAGFQDWSYLGDIRHSAGNRSAAREAYRRALAVAELNSRSQLR